MRSSLTAAVVAAVAASTLLATGVTGAPAWGDAVYHSQHIALQPVGSVGNGVGHLQLPPSAIPAGFHGAAIGEIWELAGDNGASYDTACSTVVLD